jgi:hypothetical protein
MSDIFTYVAASAIGWDDRESSGHHNSPARRTTIYHHTKSTMPHGTAALPAIMLGAGKVR